MTVPLVLGAILEIAFWILVWKGVNMSLFRTYRAAILAAVAGAAVAVLACNAIINLCTLHMSL